MWVLRPRRRRRQRRACGRAGRHRGRRWSSPAEVARRVPSGIVLRGPLGRPLPRLARSTSSRFASSSSSSARICGGQEAGVGWPRLPDRQRADRHAGGHLHDRQQASPDRRAPCSTTGTPSTGSVVIDGGHAGQMRSAAGAGDDHLKPALLGALGVVDRADRACGGRRSPWLRRRRSSSSSTSAARFIVGQSDRLPMMMPILACRAMANRWRLSRPLLLGPKPTPWQVARAGPALKKVSALTQ